MSMSSDIEVSASAVQDVYKFSYRKWKLVVIQKILLIILHIYIFN